MSPGTKATLTMLVAFACISGIMAGLFMLPSLIQTQVVIVATTAAFLALALGPLTVSVWRDVRDWYS